MCNIHLPIIFYRAEQWDARLHTLVRMLQMQRTTMGACRRLRCLDEKALLTRSTVNCGALRLPAVASMKTLISCCCFWGSKGVTPAPEMRSCICIQQRHDILAAVPSARLNTQTWQSARSDTLPAITYNVLVR